MDKFTYFYWYCFAPVTCLFGVLILYLTMCIERQGKRFRREISDLEIKYQKLLNKNKRFQNVTIETFYPCVPEVIVDEN